MAFRNLTTIVESENDALCTPIQDTRTYTHTRIHTHEAHPPMLSVSGCTSTPLPLVYSDALQGLPPTQQSARAWG